MAPKEKIDSFLQTQCPLIIPFPKVFWDAGDDYLKDIPAIGDMSSFFTIAVDQASRLTKLQLLFVLHTPLVPSFYIEPHTQNLDEDGINLEEIREFAKNFKIRRLSLGLTQTQVGQALTATEGPAYSQSAICR